MTQCFIAYLLYTVYLIKWWAYQVNTGIRKESTFGGRNSIYFTLPNKYNNPLLFAIIIWIQRGKIISGSIVSYKRVDMIYHPFPCCACYIVLIFAFTNGKIIMPIATQKCYHNVKAFLGHNLASSSTTLYFYCHFHLS